MIKCVMVNTEFSTIEDVNQPSLTSIRSSTCIKKKANAQKYSGNPAMGYQRQVYHCHVGV